MSSAADDSPEMSRLKISKKKKINKYKFIFFLLQLWLALFGLIVQKAALDCILTHKAPSKIFFVVYYYLFFRENKSWNFMWSICLGDDSPEMSRLYSLKKKKKNK